MNRTILRVPLVLLLLLSLSLAMTLPAAASSLGDLDTTFDTDGKVITPFYSYTAIGQSVAVQSDGKLVVGGISYTTISTGDFALARYNTDGSLDTTFGTGGKVTTSFGPKVATIWSVAIYKSGPHVGKIVAAGDSTASGLNVFALARYNTDGSLDTTFGGGTGKVTTSFALPGDVNVTAQALSVAIQSDDKIVAAGNTVKGFNFICFDCPANNGFNFALARYNADGSLDTSFGGTGKVITDIGGFSFGGGDSAYSVAIQSDGKIVAAGLGNPLASGNSDFALVRYNTDGTLDTTFDTDGKATTNFGTNADYGFSAAIQSDGTILVAGESSNDFALARYNTDGSVDTTFDTDGKVTTNFGGTDRGQSVTIQSDGGIVVAGNTTTPAGFYDFALARYNTNGSLDSSFGAGGKVITDFGGGGPDVGHSVAIQGDGKIVVAGHGGAAHTDFAVARYGGTVPPSNSPPLAVAGPDQVVNEGAAVQLDASASTDPDNNTLSYNWTVVSFTGPAINLSSPAVANPTFSALDDGVYTLQVTVNDGNGGTASDEVQVTVNNVAPTITAVFQVAPIPEGSVSTSGNIVAQATDPAGSNDPLTFGFDCDNNGSFETSAIPSTSAADCFFDDSGSYTVNVQVSDGDGGVATGSTIAVVTNVAPTAFLPHSPSINEGSSATFTFEAQFDPSNADTTAGFRYSFACDGNVAPLATSYAGAGTSESVSCPFADDGSYTVAGRVFDKDNGYNTYTANVNVLNVAPAVNAGADESLPFGSLVNISASFTDPGTADTWNYTISWGDGSPLATGSATVGSPITGSHQYVVAGNQTITVCVMDDDLGQGCDSLTVAFVSGIGKITGGTLRFGNNGRGGFNIQSNDGVTVKGELQYQNGSENLHAPTMTAIAVSPDLATGWFAGVLTDGRKFVAYVEDNGEPGKNDIFKLWVEGTLLNGDGKLTGGNVQIHKS